MLESRHVEQKASWGKNSVRVFLFVKSFKGKSNCGCTVSYLKPSQVISGLNKVLSGPFSPNTHWSSSLKRRGIGKVARCCLTGCRE